MDVNSNRELVSVTRSLAEWMHLINLIELACDELNNKRLSDKLRKVSGDMLGAIAPLGSLRRMPSESEVNHDR